MLAGPIPRNTNRLSIGSSDQLIGVGVGLGEELLREFRLVLPLVLPLVFARSQGRPEMLTAYRRRQRARVAMRVRRAGNRAIAIKQVATISCGQDINSTSLLFHKKGSFQMESCYCVGLKDRPEGMVDEPS